MIHSVLEKQVVKPAKDGRRGFAAVSRKETSILRRPIAAPRAPKYGHQPEHTFASPVAADVQSS
jgi:hypothetical protein